MVLELISDRLDCLIAFGRTLPHIGVLSAISPIVQMANLPHISFAMAYLSQE